MKVGNWKTQYDIHNEAPTRLEPLSKYSFEENYFILIL
jgi:hypothetical protein